MCFHYQGTVPGHLEAVSILPQGSPIKAIDNVQLLSECKKVNPGVVTILRHWEEQPHPSPIYSEVKKAAKAFFDRFIDATFRNYSWEVDYVEDWNEYYADSQSPDERALWVNWSLACMEVWATEFQTDPDYAHIKLIVANTAVGNDIPLAVAMGAVKWGAVLGYHCYWPQRNGVLWVDGQSPPSWWASYSGRFAKMDAYYKSKGVDTSKLYWMSTETGPVGHEGTSLKADDGWRHPETCNGDISKYLYGIREWLHRVNIWNSQNGNRFLGGVFFTTAGGDQWRYYETAMPEMKDIAELVKEYKTMVPPPTIPPPSPPPDTDFDGNYLFNGSFERGDWEDLPPYLGLINQQPKGWILEVSPVGSPIQYLYREADGLEKESVVQGVPECIHKLSSQLPEDQQIGGTDPLILDGSVVYKIFHHGGSFKVKLTPSFVESLTIGQTYLLELPVRTHWHAGESPDFWNSLICINTNEKWAVIRGDHFGDRTWYTVNYTFVYDGSLSIEFVQTYPNAGLDFFIDKITLTKVSNHNDDLVGALWNYSVEEQVKNGIKLNAAAGLQKAILEDGFIPVTKELYPAVNGVVHVIQAAEKLDGSKTRRLYIWSAGKAHYVTDPKLAFPVSFDKTRKVQNGR